MNGFEETEFGSRKIVRAAPTPDLEERTRKPRKAEEGGGGRRKAEEGGGTQKKAEAGKPGKGGKSKKRAKKPSKKAERAGRAKASRRAADKKPVVDEQGSGVLVPLDQWTRVLNQLGNLHEAGQQIADARERAAKAEIEAAFLRERLKEMRAELQVLKRTDVGGR